MSNSNGNLPQIDLEFKPMGAEEADRAWDDTLARVRLYAAPSGPDDRIAFILRSISFMPGAVREQLLSESSLYISLRPYSDEHVAQFIELFSGKAFSELHETHSTLVRRSDGRRCIFVYIPEAPDKKVLAGFLHQVARFAIGFSGYTANACELPERLEESAREFAGVLSVYIGSEVNNYKEEQK